MRFKNGATIGAPITAKVVDVSETGLSFSVKGDEFPDLQETLMIEFTIPGKKQIACYATVVRLDAQTSWSPEHGDLDVVKVALTFDKMPAVYREALRTSLRERVLPEDDFDDAAEVSLLKRGLNLALATAGVLTLFQTLQVPPARLIELLSKLVA